MLFFVQYLDISGNNPQIALKISETSRHNKTIIMWQFSGICLRIVKNSKLTIPSPKFKETIFLNTTTENPNNGLATDIMLKFMCMFRLGRK